MTKIEFEHVSKRYRLGTRANLRDAASRLGKRLRGKNPDNENVFWALKDVSFKVEESEILGIVGPNGAGKTTALRLLACITTPTSGDIHTNGRISALIQLGAGFHPDLTGRDNIYLNGSILGLSRKEIDNKFDRIVEFSEIGDFIDTPVKRYSSGMYVRLGFSVAAHVDPDILLIDEVLSVGDASFQAKCWRRIRELQAAKITIIFVSHNTWAVRALCDRVVLLSKGKIDSEGAPNEIIQAYEYSIRDQSVVRDNVEAPSLDPWLTPGEIEITEVVLLDKDGKAQDTFQAGEPMIVQGKYVAYKKLKNTGFELAVERSDKVWCWVARTFQDGIDIGSLEGEGEFEARIQPLQLMAGTYSLRVQIENVATVPVFTRYWKKFHVVSHIPNPGPDHGVFLPLIDWKT